MRLLGKLAAALLLMGCSGQTTTEEVGQPAPGAEPVTDSGVSADDRYIVRASGAGVTALERLGADVLFELDDGLVAARIPRNVLDAAESAPGVDGIDVDPRRYAVGEQIPYGVQMVQAAALGSEVADHPITVCVIDSGYHLAHDDLPKDVTASPDSGSGGWSADSCGHGTHVAGTIAALANDYGVVGVAPGAVRLHVVKVFGDDCGWTYSSILARAVYECVEAGAKVVNMSLGGPAPHWFEKLTFEWAWLRGVLPVAAAGNAGDDSSSYPASYAHVVSVAAVDEKATVATFSQHNDQVELAAPGVGVLSTTPGGFGAWSGTSMATPHVSGVAALIWSRHPTASNGRIRNALQKSAFDIWPEGRDSATGFGVVRAREALAALSALDGSTGGCAP